MQRRKLTQIAVGKPLTLALLTLFIVWQPRSTVASVFGDDDRVTKTPADARFRPIGMVRENARFGYATAFLIGHCHALTAKHVIHHSNPIGRTVELRFEPWQRSKLSNSASGVVVAAGRTPIARADFSEDWALLRLNRCLGRTLGYFRLSNSPLKIQVGKVGIVPVLLSVGYPIDKKHSGGPTIDPRCEVRLITSYGLMHDCATLPGNSGGPLIGWNADQGQFEVFAINVAGNHDYAPRQFDLASANMGVAVQPILAIVRSEITDQ